ncbi:aspartic protease PEP1 [Athelia psychrophila]|uniref:Aspartic protease PEP1 n=1 Tax=Athelia psychrophila TaxID=1759441 RepID=A0A166HBF7_9AGAM|nr:aspartic protease PEP1 [Fibularhizoctonia sp. CBS 109695]
MFSAAVATPVEKRVGNFSVLQTKNEKFVANGPMAYAKAYTKFGKTMPADLAAAVSGTVKASPEDAYDSEYLCPVSIGGQTLSLDFDTGSADLWVFSSKLSASESKGHTVYNSASSSTWKAKSGYTWDISYGDGSGASGTVGTDTVTIGGVTVTGQAVEIATKVSSSFVSDTANDGLVGLAFSSINTVSPTAQKTFYDNAKSSLSKGVFTADLKYHAAGTYDFGVIDSSKYTGSITYVDVDSSQGFWGFTGTGYAVGSGSFKSSSIDTIADTGTTLIYAPDAVVKAYYAQVSGSSLSSSQGGYIFPCSATLPSLTLGVGSYHAVVPGKYLNYAPATGSSCFGGIQSNTGIGQSIYGDVFLKSQFVIFDASDASSPQLGFAAKST